MPVALVPTERERALQADTLAQFKAYAHAKFAPIDAILRNEKTERNSPADATKDMQTTIKVHSQEMDD